MKYSIAIVGVSAGCLKLLDCSNMTSFLGFLGFYEFLKLNIIIKHLLNTKARSQDVLYAFGTVGYKQSSGAIGKVWLNLVNSDYDKNS